MNNHFKRKALIWLQLKIIKVKIFYYEIICKIIKSVCKIREHSLVKLILTVAVVCFEFQCEFAEVQEKWGIRKEIKRITIVKVSITKPQMIKI